MSPSTLKDENLQEREKTIFTIFSVMKFFEQIMTPIMSKCHLHPCSLLTDPEMQHDIQKMVKTVLV